MMQNISIHVASSGRASFPPIKEYGIMHFIPTIFGSKFGHSLPPIEKYDLMCTCGLFFTILGSNFGHSLPPIKE